MAMFVKKLEEQLYNALKLADAGHWHYDIKSDLFTFNDNFYSIFRSTVEKIGSYQLSSKEYATKFCHPDDIPIISEEIRKAIETDDPDFHNNLEHRILYPDDSIGFMAVRYFIEKDEKGQTVKLYGVNQNITDKHEIEQKLREEKRRLDEIIWGTGVATWEWNVQTGETRFNERWAEIVGYTLEELSPTNIDTWMRLVHPDDLEKSGALLEKNFCGEVDHYECETRMRHKNGHWVWVLDSGKVIEWTKDNQPMRMSGTHQDISSRKASEAKLSDLVRELNFQKMALDEHAIVSVANSKGLITYVNDKFCHIAGYSREELIGRNHSLLNSGFHSKEFFKDLWKTISNGDVWHGDVKNKRKDGTFYWVNATIVPYLNEENVPFQYVSIRTDITRQKEMEESLAQAQRVAKMGSWSLDLTTNTLLWSDEIYNIFGIEPEKFKASIEAFFETIHEDDLEAVQAAYQEAVEKGVPYDIEHRIIRQDNGEVRWVHEKCIHIRNDHGEVIRSDGTVHDITKRKEAQATLERLATTDDLTGLANRNQFQNRFAQSLLLANREQKKLALMLLDLDKFKPVNDTYGHQAGDAVLQKVAEIFNATCRNTDIVARLGGDEFAILLVHPEGTDHIKHIANRIIEGVRKPMSILGHEILIGTSVGIAMYPDHGVNEDELTKKADKALYDAKEAGRSCSRIYMGDANL